MFPALRQKLTELGLLNDLKKTVDTYTWQNSHGARLDVRKFINQQPYWLSTKLIESEDKRKKIILNFPIVSFSNNIWRLVSFLIEHDFQIYIWLENGELMEVTHHSRLGKKLLEKIRYDSAENIQDNLLAQGKEVSDYYVLEYKKINQLYVDLAEFVEFEDIDSPDQLLITRGLLWPRMVEQICQYNRDEKFKTIKYSYLFNSWKSSWSYEFTWLNNFKSDKFAEFIEDLAAASEVKNPGFLRREYCENLIELVVNDVSATVIDVSRFTALKKLVLKESEINTIIGLDKLNSLELLSLGHSDAKGLNLQAYPNLENTTILVSSYLPKYTRMIDLTGPTRVESLCMSVKDLIAVINSNLGFDFSQVENLILSNAISGLEFDFNLNIFSNLRRLEIIGYASEGIRGIESCVQLEEIDLKIKGCTLDVSRLTNLRIAKFYLEFNALLSGLDSCVNLERLNIYTDSKTSSPQVINLKNFSKLIDLSIDANCEYSIVGIEGCSNLSCLTLKNLNGKGLDLSNNTKLIRLHVSYWWSLKSITGLELLAPQLTGISIPEYTIKDNKLKMLISEIPYGKYTNIIKEPDINERYEDSRIFTKHINRSRVKYNNKKGLGVSSDSSSKDQVQNKGYKVNSETYMPPDNEIVVSQLFTPEAGGELLTPADDREIIFSSIIVNEDGEVLLEKASLADQVLYKIDHERYSGEQIYSAVVEMPYEVDHYIVLPGLTSFDRLVSATEEDKINIYYVEKTAQYTLMAKPGALSPPIFVEFKIAKGRNHEYKKDETVVILKDENNLNQLPQKLKFALTALFADPGNNEKFSAILNAKNENDRFHSILNYCKNGFKNERLIFPDGMSEKVFNVEVLLEIIKQQKGSCRHRSLVFMVLCHYFKYYVRIVKNQCHQFTEVLVAQDGKKLWKQVDVGGSPSKLKVVKNEIEEFCKFSLDEVIAEMSVDSTRVDERKRRKGINKVDDSDQMDLGNLSELDITRNDRLRNELRPLFTADTAWLDTCKTINELVFGLIRTSKPALLRMASASEAWLWHSLIHDFYLQFEIKTIYIDSPDELKSLFEMTVIGEGGERTIDGPLKSLVLNGNGIILVNWSNFSANERAIYKSLMDKPPTLHGYVLADEICVIGLIPERTQVNDVFLSRVDELYIPAHLKLQVLQPPKNAWLHTGEVFNQDNDKNVLTVNLYQSSEWYKLLVNELVIRDDVFSCEPGPLVSAMKNGLPIRIINAPFSDVYFSSFWRRLIVEGCIYSNGERISIAQGFELHLSSISSKTHAPDSLIFDEKRSSGKTYLFNSESLYQLFDTQHVDKDGRISIVNQGWLEESADEDQFILQGDLTPDQWQRLYDRLNHITATKSRQFHLYKESDISNVMVGPSVHLKSNDPHYVIDLMQHKHSIPAENVFYLNDQDSWCNLIESISLVRRDNKTRAIRRVMPFWSKILGGQTVILSGELSGGEYRSLQTLFTEKPYLYVNGRRKSVSGKLIWVSEKQNNLANNSIPCKEMIVGHEDYMKQLKSDFPDAFVFQRGAISQFIKAIEGVVRYGSSERYPLLSDFNYQKYKSLFEYAFRLRSHGQQMHNPVKSVLTYHYQKNSELYAYINVMAKLCFGTTTNAFIRSQRLDRLLSGICSSEDFNKSCYQIINCLSKKVLQVNLSSIDIDTDSKVDGIPALSSSTRNVLLLFLSRYSQSFKNLDWVAAEMKGQDTHGELDYAVPLNLENRHSKQIQRLMAALRDPQKPLIYLQGETGTGKTYSIRTLTKHFSHEFPGAVIHTSEDNLVRCLESQSTNRINILLLDEFNLSAKDKWEFLRGLKQNPPLIRFNGEKYPISTMNFKVVLTGNPVHYPGRHFHPVAWDHAHVIWFAPFQPTFIQRKIQAYFHELPSKENQTYLTSHELTGISELIDKVYALSRKHAKFMGEMSLRDVQNICIRCYVLKQQYAQTSWLDCIQQAILDEMDGIIFHAETRQEFINLFQNMADLNSKFKVSTIPVDSDLIIPPEKAYVWRRIMNDLAIRDLRLEQGTNLLGKLGVILQGASGVGKSVMMIKILEYLGFSRNATDPRRKFYQITVGSENVRSTLIKAFHEGSIVIPDELNLDRDLNGLLNQLLTGYDMEGNQANVPGFTLLATQNPARYAGCFVTSRDLDNRCHKIDMGDYSLNALEFIALTKGSSVARELSETYGYLRLGAVGINSRSFFSALDKVLVKENSPAQSPKM